MPGLTFSMKQTHIRERSEKTAKEERSWQHKNAPVACQCSEATVSIFTCGRQIWGVKNVLWVLSPCHLLPLLLLGCCPNPCRWKILGGPALNKRKKKLFNEINRQKNTITRKLHTSYAHTMMLEDWTGAGSIQRCWTWIRCFFLGNICEETFSASAARFPWQK